MARRNSNSNSDPAPAGTAEDPVKVAVVPAPPADNVTTAGPALTPGQAAGLDPLDPAEDARQAQDREHRTNMQTDHEAENALDPVSGGPSPGVTENAPLTAKAAGAPVTDMNGRPPISSDDKKAWNGVRDKLSEARDKDDENGVDPDRCGWRTPQDIGVPGALMKRYAEAGAPLETETVPNGHHFPETGTRYRLK